MAEKLKVSLPEFMDLGGDWIIEWDAVDPTTGASVPGVKVSNTSLQVGGILGDTGAPPPQLVEAPLLVHIDQAT